MCDFFFRFQLKSTFLKTCTAMWRVRLSGEMPTYQAQGSGFGPTLIERDHITESHPKTSDLGDECVCVMD